MASYSFLAFIFAARADCVLWLSEFGAPVPAVFEDFFIFPTKK